MQLRKNASRAPFAVAAFTTLFVGCSGERQILNSPDLGEGGKASSGGASVRSTGGSSMVSGGSSAARGGGSPVSGGSAGRSVAGGTGGEAAGSTNQAGAPGAGGACIGGKFACPSPPVGFGGAGFDGSGGSPGGSSGGVRNQAGSAGSYTAGFGNEVGGSAGRPNGGAGAAGDGGAGAAGAPNPTYSASCNVQVDDCPDGLMCVSAPWVYSGSPEECIGANTPFCSDSGCPDGFECAAFCRPLLVPSCVAEATCNGVITTCPPGYAYSGIGDCDSICVFESHCACASDDDCPSPSSCDLGSGRCKLPD
jgi:hypothetical protein